MKTTPETFWTQQASDLLLNRTIKEVRYLFPEEAEDLGWYNRCIVLVLDNGVSVYPSMDDEGNGAGALFTTAPALQTIPVL